MLYLILLILVVPGFVDSMCELALHIIMIPLNVIDWLLQRAVKAQEQPVVVKVRNIAADNGGWF